MSWYGCLKFSLIIVGLVLLIAFSIFGGLWNSMFNNLLTSQLKLSESSKVYNTWKNAPLPMYMDIYMFNWTNPEGTLKYKTPPYFKEMGPYVFRMHETKERVVWNNNNTITFNQIRTWKFVPEMSNGNLTDMVTNINVVGMTLGNLLQKLVPDWEVGVKKIIDVLIKHEEKVYITKTVKEMLFDGYYDRFLNITKEMKQFINITLPFDKFGWFYNRNGSVDYDGVFNMFTGSNDVYKLGNLYSWNYQSQTNYFNGSCSHVKGTTGELFPYKSAYNDSLDIFASDICSSLTLKKNHSAYFNSLDSNVFYGDESVFDNKLRNQKCYCLKSPCQPQGTRDLSSCRYGAPAFVSYPHFYLADPVYRTYVSGMSPSPDKHRFLLQVEKLTGVPLKVNARLQINIYTEPIKDFSFYKDLPKAYMPQIWFDQHVVISDDLSSQLTLLSILNRIAIPVLFVICAIGVLLFIIGAVMCFREKWEIKRKPNSLLRTEDIDSS